MNLSLQLHITGNCNLRCKHCYIEAHAHELSLKQIKTVFKQFDELANRLKREKKEPIYTQMRITGGEPFLHSDIYKIVKLASKRYWALAIMSNGTVLDKKMIKLLKRLPNLQCFQVSMDGNEETHDKIRGTGNYQAVIKALDVLYENRIRTRVSFTANADNFIQFPLVAQICRKHHVNSLWSDRYIPIGSSGIKAINNDVMPKYVEVLQREHDNVENIKAGLSVENFRALQFIGSQNAPYYCKAGENLITIDEYGNIMPCRRLPVICGNIFTTTISEVYFNNRVFQDLRNHEGSEKCNGCIHGEKCRGGSRCMAYAVVGDYNSPDPCCYI